MLRSPPGMQCFGTYPSAPEAAVKYDLAVWHIYGDAAVLNFPLTRYIDVRTQALKPEFAQEVAEQAVAAKAAGIERKRGGGGGGGSGVAAGRASKIAKR
jgi:hypothetical protein